MEPDRKKEVINVCLDHFIEKGLSETSTRSLSAALKLQNAGLYYYFSSKDEAVILCSEEAALRLENALLLPALKDLSNPDLMMNRLQSRADEMAPTMRFLASVCASKRYKDSIKPVLDGLSKRYGQYAERIAKILNCEAKEILPYVYMAITSLTNYMIFKEDEIVYPQIQIIKSKLTELISA